MRKPKVTLAQRLTAVRYNIPDDTAHLINMTKVKQYENYLKTDEAKLERWLDELHPEPNV